jgi:hypothetical protein
VAQIPPIRPMTLARLLRPVLALLCLLSFITTPGQAQKLSGKYYEDTANGYRFKPLEDYVGVPIRPGEDSGLVTQMTSGSNEIHIYALYDQAAQEGADGRTTAGKRRTDIAAVLSNRFTGFKGIADKPDSDEQIRAKDLTARRRIWTLRDWYVETWTFTLSHADIVLVYLTEKARFDKKWRATLDSSGKSFQAIERKATADLVLGKGATYEQQLEKAAVEAKKAPGWRALPTPSKKFIIVTNCEKPQFIDEVIERLEGARIVFEIDYPPSPDFDAVSIVRICATAEEFQQYGNTPRGVAGWFSPTSTELVLYDAVNTDRNMTYAVVVHESFHQYCHFLFDQAEAHRWFDEGHGDYYGGLEFKTARPKITTRMPAGLNRLDEIRQMVRNDSTKSIEEHVNYDHESWHRQGPSPVSCYAQSWAIVYYLRQGAEGNVPRKVWKKEYADIIPSYVRVLSEGYRAAFEEIRDRRRKEAEAEGKDPAEIDLRVNRMQMLLAFGPGRKDDIWKAAMDASWGQIDMDEFEQNWLAFVEDHLK